MITILRSLIIFSIIMLCFGISSIAEEITLTTYYPAPLGVYDALLTKTLGIGDTNADTSFSAADIPTTSGDVWIAGNVGIGTITPQNELDVKGSVAIGANYAGIQLAPANGMVVEGQVGIGMLVPNPTSALDVNGKVSVTGQVDATAGYSVNGTAGWTGTFTAARGGLPITVTVVNGIITDAN